MRQRWDERIKLRHLRVAAAVQDHGSVTEAAASLLISQAAVSKTISEAEDVLETDLFVRRGRAIVATQAGEQFIRSGRRIMAEMRVLAEEIDLLAQGVSGVVTIGASAVSAHMIAARAIAAVKRRSPGINIRLMDDYGASPLPDLRSGVVDLAITPMIRSALAPDLDGVAIVQPDPVAVASIGHPVLALQDAGWPELMAHAWCLAPLGSRWRNRIEAYWAEMRVPSPRNLVETPSALSLLALLRAMPALTVLPRGLAESWEGQGYLTILPHAVPLAEEPVGLIWSTVLPLAPAARVFREEILALVEEDGVVPDPDVQPA